MISHPAILHSHTRKPAQLQPDLATASICGIAGTRTCAGGSLGIRVGSTSDIPEIVATGMQGSVAVSAAIVSPGPGEPTAHRERCAHAESGLGGDFGSSAPVRH